jgi:hypothetical protein
VSLILSTSHLQGGADHPPTPLAPAKVLRADAQSSLLRMAPRRARSRSGSAPTRRWLTLSVPRLSRCCGRSFATMAPRSTGR